MARRISEAWMIEKEQEEKKRMNESTKRRESAGPIRSMRTKDGRNTG